MDRRRFVLTASSAAALSSAAAQASTVAVQRARSSVREYVGAMIVMRRSVGWVQDEVTRLMDAEDLEDEEWRIDVLAPFAVVDALRETAVAMVPPGKHVTTHELWVDALDEFVAAGLHLRTAVLDDNERSFDFALRAMDRAASLVEEVDTFLPRRVRGSS